MASTYCIEVKIHRAENLPKADTLGKIDAYVKLTFRNVHNHLVSVRTDFIESNYNPVWEQTLLTSDIVLNDSSSVLLEVYDVDTLTSDDLVGDAVIPLRPGTPLRGARVQLNLKPKFKPSNSAAHSFVILSLGAVLSPAELKARIDRQLDAYYNQHPDAPRIPANLHTKDGRSYRVTAPVLGQNGLFVQAVYEKKSDDHKKQHGYELDIFLLETANNASRLALYAMNDFRYVLKFSVKKETWANGTAEFGPQFIVYSAVKMNDVPFFSLQDPWSVIVGPSQTVWTASIDQIVSNHGWKGSLNYQQAKKILRDVKFNDKTESIYFLEPYGVLKIDYDKNDVDICYMQYAAHRFAEDRSLLFCDITCTKTKKRFLTYYNGTDHVESDQQLCSVAKLDDLEFGTYFKDMQLYVHKMGPQEYVQTIPVLSLLPIL